MYAICSHLLGHHIAQLDVLGARDGGRAVVLDELVQTAELHHPEEELALRVPQDFEVLHAVRASAKIIRC